MLEFGKSHSWEKMSSFFSLSFQLLAKTPNPENWDYNTIISGVISVNHLSGTIPGRLNPSQWKIWWNWKSHISHQQLPLHTSKKSLSMLLLSILSLPNLVVSKSGFRLNANIPTDLGSHGKGYLNIGSPKYRVHLNISHFFRKITLESTKMFKSNSSGLV